MKATIVLKKGNAEDPDNKKKKQVSWKGGPGSGFEGHAGIPGHQGGSQASGGGGSALGKSAVGKTFKIVHPDYSRQQFVVERYNKKDDSYSVRWNREQVGLIPGSTMRFAKLVKDSK